MTSSITLAFMYNFVMLTQFGLTIEVMCANKIVDQSASVLLLEKGSFAGKDLLADIAFMYSLILLQF